MNAADRATPPPERAQKNATSGSASYAATPTAIDLLRANVPHAARNFVAQEACLPHDAPAAELVRAALRSFSSGQVRDPRLRLLAMAATHLLLQIPQGDERDRLTDLVEDVVARCRVDPSKEDLIWS